MSSLPRVPYFTDNPFRLLGVGSSTSLAELRQRARAAERALLVGLPTAVHLREFLGDEELSACAGQVRALATNARALMLYRLFWPLEGVGASAAEGRPDDETETPARTQQVQQQFLEAWLAFLAEPDPELLARALSLFRPLYTDEYIPDHLGDLLLDDGVSAAERAEVVDAAQREAAELIFGIAAQKALDLWDTGATDLAMKLVEVLVAQDLIEEFYAKAFSGFTPVGDALSRTVQALPMPDAAELVDGPLPEPDCVLQLRILARRLEAYLIPAGRWQSVWSRYVVDIGNAAHDAAQSLVDTAQDYERAEAVLTRLLAWPISAEWRREVERDLVRVRALGAVPTPEPEPVPAEPPALPLGKPPVLFTWNGMGTKLYGQTLFFVVLFIPVLPLARFVVRPEGGGYVFLGRRPFAVWHKLWIAALCLALFGLPGYRIWVAPQLKRPAQAGPAPDGSARDPYMDSRRE